MIWSLKYFGLNNIQIVIFICKLIISEAEDFFLEGQTFLD